MQKILSLFISTIILTSINLYADDNFKLYGSARLSTFYTDESDSPAKRDRTNTVWELQNNSRVGGIIENDLLKGGFEIGNNFGDVEFRKLYGEKKISDKINLLIGIDYTPLNYFPSNQVGLIYNYKGGFQGDTGLKPYGGIYNGYNAMIQLSTDRLKIALIEPATIDAANLKLGVTGEIDKVAPKVELAYHIGSDTQYVDFYSGYQAYKIIEDITIREYDINSYVFGLNYGLNLGPVIITGNAYSGQNIATYGLWAEGDDSPRIIANEIYDCTTDGYILVLGFRTSPKTILETGVGYIAHSVDGAVADDETLSVYLNLQYQLKSFHFVPELGIVDSMTDNAENDEGKKLYIGAKWQINF